METPLTAVAVAFEELAHGMEADGVELRPPASLSTPSSASAATPSNSLLGVATWSWWRSTPARWSSRRTTRGSTAWRTGSSSWWAISSAFLKADLVFLSPPWGGPSYNQTPIYTLDMLKPKDGYAVFQAAQGIAPNIVMFLPWNVDIRQVEELTWLSSPPLDFEVLCKSHPVEFASYFHYCHSLTFDQRPDYGFLRRLFRDLFDREGYQFDHVFDWTLLKCKQSQKAKAQQQDPGASSRPVPMNMDKHQVSGSRPTKASGQLEAEQRPAIRMQFRSTAENSRSNNRHPDKLRVGTSTDNALLQSTSFGLADAPRKNMTVSKTQGLADPQSDGANNPGPFIHL